MDGVFAKRERIIRVRTIFYLPDSNGTLEKFDGHVRMTSYDGLTWYIGVYCEGLFATTFCKCNGWGNVAHRKAHLAIELCYRKDREEWTSQGSGTPVIPEYELSTGYPQAAGDN